MEAPVGERFAYNQTNYALLAQIIAKQTKMPYERYLAERQFAMVGMPLSTFGDSYDLVANAATMYSYFSRAKPTRKATANACPIGSTTCLVVFGRAGESKPR